MVLEVVVLAEVVVLEVVGLMHVQCGVSGTTVVVALAVARFLRKV